MLTFSFTCAIFYLSHLSSHPKNSRCHITAFCGLVKLVDDYGHHPKEVEATIKAARASHPDRRLVMMFQPHRFSRTRDCFDDFVDVLSQVDQLLLLEVYPAGEKPIVGADSRALARSIRLRGEVEPILVDPVEGNLPNVLQKVLQANVLLLTQGAGNVGAISVELAQHRLYAKYCVLS